MNEDDLSRIAQTLWELDENRLLYNKNYAIDLQRTAVHLSDTQFQDRCDKPLFKYIDESIFQKPTFAKLIKLMDNYNQQVGQKEEQTDDEIKEENAFIDACFETKVMQEAYKFLVTHNKITSSVAEFKTLLWKIWFRFYNRSSQVRIADSCAFEHVFVGEMDKDGVSGCHNWVRYYLLEKNNKANYFGYKPNKCEYTSDKTHPTLLTMQFWKDGSVKAVGGYLIGVSPEFEMALYTIIYLCTGDKTEKVKLNFANMNIIFYCYRIFRAGRSYLATIYPSKS